MEWEGGRIYDLCSTGWLVQYDLFFFVFVFVFVSFFSRAFVICWVHDFYSRLVGFIELPLIVDTFIHAQPVRSRDRGGEIKGK